MYQTHTLDNGLRLFFVPVRSVQSVSVGIFVNIGSRYEPKQISGISHFIEHMLFKGTKQRPNSRVIAEAIEGIGGVTNAYTSTETTVYYTKVAANQTTTAIDVITDLIRHPLFRLEDIERERMIIGEEISMTYDSPESWVNIMLDEVIWPDHPLGHDVAGTHESLLNIQRDNLLTFYRAGYHPGNFIIAVGGNFDPDLVLAEIARRLGDWQPAAQPIYQAAPAVPPAPRWQVERRSIEQAHLCLALPALSRKDPDRYALSVMNAILGDGMSSRLFLNIREERGLAYAVDSGLNLLQDTGTMVIYAGVDPERAPEALRAVLAELLRLRDEPVSEAELHRAKEYLKGRLVLGLEDSFSQTAWVATQALLMDEIRTPEAVLESYGAITVADVQAVAQRVIKPSAYNLAAIGPFNSDEPLAGLLT